MAPLLHEICAGWPRTRCGPGEDDDETPIGDPDDDEDYGDDEDEDANDDDDTLWAARERA
jgi:hypothetical protein